MKQYFVHYYTTGFNLVCQERDVLIYGKDILEALKEVYNRFGTNIHVTGINELQQQFDQNSYKNNIDE